MAKKDGIIGLYAAHGRLSMAMATGKGIKSAWVDIPDNIVRNGEIISKNLFATFLKDTMKEEGFHAKKAAFVISEDQALIRTVHIPKMTAEQVRVNLPFEFKDYIRGELRDYHFDYLYRVDLEQTGTETGATMELLGVAIPSEYYATLKEIIQMAGLKLVRAIPEICVLERYLLEYGTDDEIKKERCFLDIGNRNIRMRILKDGKFKLAHVIDIGENHIVHAIEEFMNVDTELARTYMRTNYENCDSTEGAINAYKDISLEVLKGFNFYEMSDMTARLNDVVLYGNGAKIEPLVEILKERINMNTCTMNEAFPKYGKDSDFNITAVCIGALLENDSAKAKKDSAGLKEYINFAETNKKKTNYGAFIAAMIFIVAAFGLILKFGILDRFDKMYEKQAQAAEMQELVEANLIKLSDANDVNEEFYHFTWTDMTEDERNQIRMLDIFKLIRTIDKTKVTTKGMSIANNQITTSITVDTLENVSEFCEELKKQELVESVSVLSAQKKEETTIGETKTDPETGEIIEVKEISKAYVEASIIIRLKGLDNNKEENGE